jgi:hypothetical protein
VKQTRPPWVTKPFVVMSPIEAACSSLTIRSIAFVSQDATIEIRQDRDSSRHKPLREAGVRAVDPKCLIWVVPGSGIGMALMDRHTLLMG